MKASKTLAAEITAARKAFNDSVNAGGLVELHYKLSEELTQILWRDLDLIVKALNDYGDSSLMSPEELERYRDQLEVKLAIVNSVLRQKSVD